MNSPFLILNKLQHISIKYYNAAGGIIYDSTIHDLDMSLWLAGSQPESVYVSASAFDPDIASCDDFDQVVVTIKFKNGVVSSVENGRVAPYGYDQRLEVCIVRMSVVGYLQILYVMFQKASIIVQLYKPLSESLTSTGYTSI